MAKDDAEVPWLNCDEMSFYDTVEAKFPAPTGMTWELFRDLADKYTPQSNLTRPRQLPAYIETFWLKSIELRMSHWSGDDIRAQLKLMTGLIVKVHDRLVVDAGLHGITIERGQWPVLTWNVAPTRMTPEVDFTGMVRFNATPRFSAPTTRVLERRELTIENETQLAWADALPPFLRDRALRFLPEWRTRSFTTEQVPVERELRGSCLIRVALNGVGKRVQGA